MRAPVMALAGAAVFCAVSALGMFLRWQVVAAALAVGGALVLALCAFAAASHRVRAAAIVALVVGLVLVVASTLWGGIAAIAAGLAAIAGGWYAREAD